MKATCIHLIFLLCISLFAVNSKAQEEKPIRYLVEIGGGTNLLLSRTSSTNPTSLLSYRQRSLPVFNIQYTYFLGSHWGIYANLQAMLPGRKNRMLYETLASPYENEYYISGYREDQDANTLAYGIVGIAYRMRWNKWSISPRLGLGFAETRITNLDFTLKGKENNEIYQISYNTKKIQTILPAFCLRVHPYIITYRAGLVSTQISLTCNLIRDLRIDSDKQICMKKRSSQKENTIRPIKATSTCP
ncbi:MAG: porin family protein [Bacteroides sp.]|nr:porin family protein [Bacteroides sp.]